MKPSQLSISAGEVSPGLHARSDMTFSDRGLSYGRNMIVRKTGGGVKRGGLKFVARAFSNTQQSRLIPYDFGLGQTYAIELCPGAIQFCTDGARLLSGSTASISGATQADPCVVTTAASHGLSDGDVVEISGVAGMTELNGRSFVVANATVNTFELETLAGGSVDSTGYGAWSSGGTVATPLQASGTVPYAESELFDISYVSARDDTELCHWSHPPATLSRLGATSFAYAETEFGVATDAPEISSATPSGSGAVSKPARYKVTAENDETGEESLPSDEESTGGTGTADEVTVSWPYVTGCEFYKVYKENGSGVFGYIGRASGTSGTVTFLDDGYDPDETRTPPTERTPFAAADDYPEAVTYYQQRRHYASTVNDPTLLEMSRSALFANFTYTTPSAATDAIKERVQGRTVNRIRHLIPLRDLVALTTGGVASIKGTDEGVLKPGENRINIEDEQGVDKVRPVVVGKAIIAVMKDGRTVRDMGYAFSDDAYIGKELSAPSEHLLEDRSVVDMAYQEARDSVVWFVLDDGTALSLTYMPEHEVFGWMRHETDGEFESVCVVNEGRYDAPYFIVKRTIGEQTVRCIERMEERDVSSVAAGFYVDSGLTYSGSAVSRVTGLDHLIGAQVVALADGDVIRKNAAGGDLVVDADGGVDLPIEASLIHVGLEYAVAGRTLPFNPELSNGSTGARRKIVTELAFRLRDTVSVTAGRYGSNYGTETLAPLLTENYGDPMLATTGVARVPIRGGWDEDCVIEFSHSDPTHFEILALYPTIELGE